MFIVKRKLLWDKPAEPVQAQGPPPTKVQKVKSPPVQEVPVIQQVDMKGPRKPAFIYFSKKKAS